MQNWRGLPLTKSLKSFLDLFLFRGRGILPTTRLLVTYLALALVLIGLSFMNASWSFILFANGFVLLCSLFDLFLTPKRKELIFNRIISEKLERDLVYEVTIDVTNKSNKPFQFVLQDDLPQSFIKEDYLRGEVQAEDRKTFTYKISAPVRGDYKLEYLHIRYSSPLGLWAKQLTVHEPDEVKVIPDLSEVKDYLQDAQRFLMYEGLKIKKQQVGTGEFASIRNYVVGDDPRRINWHQTAKLQEVMTNEYEPEHGKYITILIDCGRMMGVELREANRLEKAIEAAITLATAALQNGDHVSVLCFSKEVKAFVPAGHGLEHIDTILQTIYAMEVDAQESNYQLALQYAQSAQRKRSMMVLFSDVQTFINEDFHLFYMKEIRKKHLFVMIGIEDHLLREKIEIYPESIKLAMQKSIAQKQYLRQKQIMTKWEKHGLPMLEAPAERLAVTAVSHYVDTLNRGLL